MPKPRKRVRVACPHFTWLLGLRNSTWQADGRSNTPDVGRHSLGTGDMEEAQRLLVQLDRVMAVRHGLVAEAEATPSRDGGLPLEEGRQLYMEHSGRAHIAGGVRPASLKRYRAVFDKFAAFAHERRLMTWDRVNSKVLGAYASHLESEGYAPRTQYLELTTLKQTIGWLTKQGYLPEGARVHFPMAKPEGTDTYCWRDEEVRAMLDHCRGLTEAGWLGAVILALATTGMRISELAALRWSDIDLESVYITLKDETGSAHRGRAGGRRTLKSGKGRSFPIQQELLPVLRALPRAADGFVFHGPRGGRLKPDVVRRSLIRDVLEPLGPRFPTPEGEVGFAEGRLHSFRHYFCSLCANRGVAQRVVMRWLGHSSSRMVEHYYHLHDEEARRQMGRIQLYSAEDGGRVAADD